MPKKRWLLLVVAIWLVVVNTVLFAAEPADVPVWEPVSPGPINGWAAPICGEKEFFIQPFLFINNIRGSYDSSGSYTALPDDDKATATQLYLYLQYGATDKLSLGGQILHIKNFVRETGVEADSMGFGDTNLFALYCLQEEEKGKPCVTLLAQLKIPTGKFEAANPDSLGTDIMGTGSYDPGLGVILTKNQQPFVLHADLIYSIPLKTTVDQLSTKYGTYWNYDAAVEVILAHGFNILLEGNGFSQGKTAIEGTSIDDTNSSYITFGPGIGWSNDKIQTLISRQITTRGKNSDATDAWVFTLIYNF